MLYIVCFTKNKQKFLLCNCNLQSKNYKYSQKLNNTFMTIRNLCQCKFALTSISSGRFWQACCRVVSMCLFVNNIHCIHIIENCKISLKNTPIKLIFPDFFFFVQIHSLVNLVTEYSKRIMVVHSASLWSNCVNFKSF